MKQPSQSNARLSTPPLVSDGESEGSQRVPTTDSQSSLMRKVVNAAVQVASSVLPRTPSKRGSQETVATPSSPSGSQATGATASINVVVNTSESPAGEAQGNLIESRRFTQPSNEPSYATTSKVGPIHQPADATSSDRRRLRTVWSAEEENYLMDGCERFGVGNWALILRSYPFNEGRTGVDLKDKFRNLQIQQTKKAARPPSVQAGGSGRGCQHRIVDIGRESGSNRIMFKYSVMPHRWQNPTPALDGWNDILKEYSDTLAEKYFLVNEVMRQAGQNVVQPALQLVRNESAEDVFHEAQEESTTTVSRHPSRERSVEEKGQPGRAKKTQSSKEKVLTIPIEQPKAQPRSNKQSEEEELPIIEIQKQSTPRKNASAVRQSPAKRPATQPLSQPEPREEEFEPELDGSNRSSRKKANATIVMEAEPVELTEAERSRRRQAVEKRLKRLQYMRA